MELKRNAVVALYLEGKPQADIVRELNHLNVNKMFVHRTIKRYKESGSIAKRYGGGRQRTVTSPEMIQKVEARIQQEPTISGNKLSKELGISLSRIQHILKNHLGLKLCKIPKEYQPSTSDDSIPDQTENVEEEETKSSGWEERQALPDSDSVEDLSNNKQLDSLHNASLIWQITQRKDGKKLEALQI